ncbi:MAG: hypothetical protein JXA71_11190 [Chitinispirillaceae bacterium]|nr:hypothetical protein [Chitinispirillaceae bacterium]
MDDIDENIHHTIALTRQLIHCADIGDQEREDDTCGVLYGIVRDCAYRILGEAERERLRHIDHDLQRRKSRDPV